MYKIKIIILIPAEIRFKYIVLAEVCFNIYLLSRFGKGGNYGNQRCYIFKHTSIKTIYLSKKSFGDSTLCHYSVHNEYIQTYLSKKYILKPIFLKYTYWNKCYTLLYIHLHLYIITVHIFKQYFDITVYWKVCLYINSIFKPISAYIQK